MAVNKVESWIELIKACIRPFIILWGFITYGICVMNGITVPDLLSALIAAAIIEYFGERAVIRLRTPSVNVNTKGE
jgi:hypothetical protein